MSIEISFDGLGMGLGNLARLSNAQARSISAENPTGEKGRGGMATDGPFARASRELGQELMKKLKAWTGRVWIVAVSDEEGVPPLGAQRREKDAREIEAIREHPKVKEVLQHFPGARISAVRPTAKPATDAGAPEEADDLKEDGTTR